MVSTKDSSVSIVLSSVLMLLEDKHLINALEKTCNVSVAQLLNYRYKVTQEELAKQWNIGLLTAKRTLLAMTQRGVKDIAS
jgi:DNA-binding transcriptional regulator LsrR (DeoR family)